MVPQTRECQHRKAPVGLCFALFALGCTALFPLRPAAAQTTVIGLAPTGSTAESNATTSGVSSYSLGFAFTANSAFSVTSLGYFYDPSFNPNADPTVPYTSFTSPHQVGLYTDSGTLLTSVDVTAQGTQDGFFLYQDIAPVTLSAGQHYVIAGVTGATDPYLYTYDDGSGASGITVDPAITYDQNRYTVSNTLAYAGNTDPTLASGFFGPNFKIVPASASAAPEPGEWSVLAFAALGLGTLIVRVRRRASGHSPS
jgi:MYXO-CTERM domain-containing protein